MAHPTQYSEQNILNTIFDNVLNALGVNLKGKVAGEELTKDLLKVEQQFTYSPIATATTTVIATGAGLLHSVTVNGGTAGTIIIYDNTAGSGTIIASFDSTNALATYMLNAKFLTGLTVVTGAATKVTVTWRL